jgi:D-alanyl-D-alanine carboxypeptidase
MQTDTISQDRYVYLCNAAHDKLTNEQGYKKTFKSGDLDMKIQHIWSNRLPGASAKAYCRWMNDFNMKRIFSDTPSEHVLRALLEQDAQSHTTKGLKHMGYKGGSTAFVLTLAAYATDKQNNSGALAVFFNNLGALENMRLQMSLHEFKDKIFSDSLFRHKIEEEFNKPH